MMNSKLENLVASFKESYFKTPVSKRFPTGCFTGEYIEKASKEIHSVGAWFSWESPDTAKEWAEQNLPNWNGSCEQIKAFEHFMEQFVLKCGKDDKFDTDQLLYRGCLQFNEYPYFIELLKFFDVNKFLASTEIKSSTIMALMSNGYKISLTGATLTDQWKHRSSEYANLFLIEC